MRPSTFPSLPGDPPGPVPGSLSLESKKCVSTHFTTVINGIYREIKVKKITLGVGGRVSLREYGNWDLGDLRGKELCWTV